ncbi:hypothetical protein OF83DRAFT_1225017 [Amylostereum chailletii]|nr:hypothetical protein OF83DRAFT_1225017 [Amylostereum chailletii]
MENCPPEILHIIFSYACSDSGATARALSLASRYISSSASLFLYQSLSLTGVQNICKLLSSLRNLPDPQRLVYHLFLADNLNDQATTALYHAKSDIPVLGIQNQALQATEESPSVIVCIEELLSLIAPTLRTFTWVISGFVEQQLFNKVFQIPFPILTTLTIHLASPRQAYGILLPPRMPRLHRFHISSQGYLSTKVLPVIAPFAEGCPRLSHLRISEARLMPGCPAVLARLLGRLPLPTTTGFLPSANVIESVPRIPFNIRSVVLQMEEGAPHYGGGDLVKQMSEMDYKDGFALQATAPRRTLQEWKNEWAKEAAGDDYFWITG